MLAPLRVWRRVSILESSRQSPAQTGPWFLPVPCPCSRGRESGRSCLRGSGKVGRTGPPSCFSRPHRGGRWLWLLPHQCPVPLGTGPHPAASLVLRAGPMRGQSWAPLGGGGGDGCGSHGQEDRTSGGCALPGPACTCACERGPGLCPPGGGAGSVQREGCHLPSSPPWGHPGGGPFAATFSPGGPGGHQAAAVGPGGKLLSISRLILEQESRGSPGQRAACGPPESGGLPCWWRGADEVALPLASASAGPGTVGSVSLALLWWTSGRWGVGHPGVFHGPEISQCW